MAAHQHMTGLGEWDEDDESLGLSGTGAGERAEPPLPEASHGTDEEAPRLYYPSLDAFVRDQLAPTYRRHLDGRNRTWCPQWWRHAEAITRLEALWRAWEHLRLDPATGISVWLRDHADHHMAVLLDPDGPFKGCTPEKGHGARLGCLPLDTPPAGLFVDQDCSGGGGQLPGPPQ